MVEEADSPQPCNSLRNHGIDVRKSLAEEKSNAGPRGSYAGVKPDPSLERARLARARRLLYPSPELSQADPLPAKDWVIPD